MHLTEHATRHGLQGIARAHTVRGLQCSRHEGRLEGPTKIACSTCRISDILAMFPFDTALNTDVPGVCQCLEGPCSNEGICVDTPLTFA